MRCGEGPLTPPSADLSPKGRGAETLPVQLIPLKARIRAFAEQAEHQRE